jgi:carbonic anhydrase
MLDLVHRYDPNQRLESQPLADAHDACCRLEEGNQLFASLVSGTGATNRIVGMEMGELGMAGPGSIPVQQPFAVVLGCSDARVPTEMIFDCGYNELFVVRVAGNIISQEQLESIDYAVEYLGQNLKLLVVLGHSQCGAVSAAVDAFLSPAEHLELSSSHHLRSIINILFPSVRRAVRSLSIRWGDKVSNMAGYRTALIECSAMINAALMSSVLVSKFSDPTRELRVVFGVYDLVTHRVHASLSPVQGLEPAICLMDAPVGLEAFRQFSFQLASSEYISQLLHHREDR